MNRLAILVLLLILSVPATAPRAFAARPLDSWPEIRLWKQADAVVMATAQGSQSHNRQGVEFDSWVPVRTTFEVQAVLKGERIGKRLTFQHYRYIDRRAAIKVIDGPVFVSFDTHAGTRYLLFLKAPKTDRSRAEEVFEPLSGQMDPGLSMSRLASVQ